MKHRTSTYSTVTGLLIAGAAAWYLLTNKQQETMPTNSQLNTDSSLPRGYRNNNPLNIRYNTRNNWNGKVLPNTDGVFEQFRHISYGYRAAIRLIQNYIKAGLTTVSDIISKWAPNNENNTAGYINRVCQTTGFMPATIIETPDQLKQLVYAMAIVENGYTPMPNMQDIEEGWKML